MDAQAKTITVMVTRELTFTVTDDTKIVQGDAAKTLADIKEGDTVTVVYMRESADKRVATKITIGGCQNGGSATISSSPPATRKPRAKMR